MAMPCWQSDGAGGNLHPGLRYLRVSVSHNGIHPCYKCECHGLVLSSVLVAGAGSPSKMTTLRRSPNFPAFLVFLLLEGAGRCCWHPMASALLMCGALAWSWPDLQVHRGTGVQWDPMATVKGVGSPQTQAAAQHFGRVA